MDLHPLKNDHEITQPWIEKMLSLKMECSIKINSWSSTLPRQREGFLSEIAFVKIQYTTPNSEENMCRLVFKFLPQDPKLILFLTNGRLIKRESQFYRFIISPNFCLTCTRSGIDIPVPEVFYANYSDSAITIILHDLNVDNYKSVVIRDGSTLAQTKTALRAMAVIHGAGILYLQQHQADEYLSPLADDFKTDFYEQFLGPNMETLIEMYAGTSLGEVFKDIKPLIKHIHSTSKRHPLIKTVVHGDLWAGQLLFSADESSVKIIDWQFCHLDNPVGDIMSMFFMSTNPHVLEEHLEDIVHDYYDALCRVVEAGGGKMVVTFEEMMANVEEMWMYGFMFLEGSIHDFLSSDNISKERLLGAFTFLEKRGVFAKFLAEFSNDVSPGT